MHFRGYSLTTYIQLYSASLIDLLLKLCLTCTYYYTELADDALNHLEVAEKSKHGQA